MNRNESFSPLDVSSIEIRLTYPSLDVLVDDTDTVQILIAGDENSAGDLKVSLENGCLQVDQPAKGIAYKITQPIWLQITVRIPRSWEGGIDLSTVSGRLTAQGLRGTDIFLESASGDLLVNHITGTNIKLVTVSGNVDATDTSADICVIRAVSGDVRITDGSASHWKLTAVSGDITIDMSNPFEKLGASSVSGNVRVTVPMSDVDAYIRSVTGRIRTRDISITENAPKVSLTTVSGDLDIRSINAVNITPADY